MSGDGATHAEASGSFAIDVPVFQGPFRLLADLILEQKVDVCDVPVASVTDRYLAHAKEAQGWNLEEATWFLAICAVLLELKVARLTPRHTEPDEEDLLGGSPDLAYARSLELRAFRKVAVELARRLEDEAGFFARDVGPGPGFSHLYPDPMEKVVRVFALSLAQEIDTTGAPFQGPENAPVLGRVMISICCRPPLSWPSAAKEFERMRMARISSFGGIRPPVKPFM